MNRFLLAVLAFWTLGSCSLVAERPNVIVILSDDLGWGSVGCYGANPELVSTPNIDRLASQGRRFTDANTTSSVCSPTRYALMTGRYCWRTSLISEVLGTTAPLHIETSRLTLASMLKEQGYNCAAVGKWHLGYGTKARCDFTQELKPGPLEIGFDYHFGVPSNHGDVSGVYVENHWVYGLDKQSPSSPSPPYMTMGEQQGRSVKSLALNAPKRVDDEVMSTLTDKMVHWIEQQSNDKPFFAYFTPVAVHNPITPSKQTAGKSKGGLFCDFIHDLDTSVGRILDALDKQGLAQNTLFIFTSDNGGVNKQNGDTPQNVARNAGLDPVGPFRGGKHDVWEGGFRVPYLVRWPGHVPAGSTCDETISLVDTLASIAAITGARLPSPSQAAEDSHDVSKAWLGVNYTKPLRPDVIVHSADGNFAIRKGAFKWIEGVPAIDVKPAAKKSRADQMTRMLYDLKSDIAESKDVSTEQSKVVEDLESLLNRYRDGGYSRELPPASTKPKTATPSALPQIVATDRTELTLNKLPSQPWTMAGGRDRWSVRDDALWVQAEKTGSPLAGPIAITDGIIELQVRLGEANRLSLRIQSANNPQTFRIVLSRGTVEIALNAAKNEPGTTATQLGRTSLKFDPNQWQTFRVTFKGDELTVDVAGEKLQAKQAAFSGAKEQVSLIPFDGEVGMRKLVIAKATGSGNEPK